MASKGDVPEVVMSEKKRTREEEHEEAVSEDCAVVSTRQGGEGGGLLSDGGGGGVPTTLADGVDRDMDRDMDRVENKRPKMEGSESVDGVKEGELKVEHTVKEIDVRETMETKCVEPEHVVSVSTVTIVEVQETIKLETLTTVSEDAPAANPLDSEVRKIADSARNDTGTMKNLNGGEETGRKGTNVPGGGKVGKKRKIAILLAYCGVGYQGMQRNPGAVTIEGELEQALFRADAIAQCNFGDLRKIDWMRAARTDKGVSAVGQIVSARLIIDPPGFVERVNQHLPREIRVLGYKRTTSNFNAKQMCDKRRYEYVIPVYAFDPNAHHDRETMLAWTEKKESDRLLRIEKRKALQKKDSDNLDSWEEPAVAAVASGTSTPNNGTSLPKATERETEATYTSHEEGENGSLQMAKIEPPTKVELDGRQESTTAAEHVENADLEVEEQVPYVFGQLQLKQLNRILSKYCGTHNFHNFTARVRPEDPSAIRYMLSFKAGEPFEINGMQFVSCTVVGQSFMLHQIRKMIGMAIAIMRGCAPETIIDTSLKRDTDVNVPMAPELGLFLNECYYTAYNRKFSFTHPEINQEGYQDMILNFKKEVIYSHIATTEARDGTMALWLHCLNDRSYPDFVKARESAKSE